MPSSLLSSDACLDTLLVPEDFSALARVGAGSTLTLPAKSIHSEMFLPRRLTLPVAGSGGAAVLGMSRSGTKAQP